MKDFYIHAWEIEGYIKLNPEFAKYIENLIKKKFNSFNNFAKISKVNRKAIIGVCHKNKKHKGFIKISRLFILTNLLEIDKNKVEKQIELYKDSKAGAHNRVYRIKFPFLFSPLSIRLISHVIGDGSVYEDHLRYTQQNVSFIYDLSEKLLNPIDSLTKTRLLENGRFKEEAFNIPMFIAKCACKILGIPRDQLNSHLFLEKCLDLQRNYRIQVLAAIMVDEGCIESKTIRMNDKKIVETICKLIDSLGYKRGELKSRQQIKNCFGKLYESKMYGVQLHAEGLRDFLNDIKKCTKKFGNLTDLWQKQKDLEQRFSRHDYQYLKKINETKRLRKKIINIFQEDKIIKRNDIVEKFNANPDNVRYILKTLQQENMIVRIGHGVYSYAKNR